MKYYSLLFLFSSFLISSVFAQNDNFISFNQKTEIIIKKKKTQSIYNVYFDKEKNTIVKHIEKPVEMITSTNAFGELSIYYPKLNQVSFQQVNSSSSKLNLIYYFANNQTDHLGLAEEGFQLESKKYENDFLITIWKSTNNLLYIDQVKMVFDKGIPIFAAYLDTEEKVLKKIYYSNYIDLNSFRLPSRIIEISYTSSTDSIVNRTIFSNIEVSNLPNSNYFNFKAPEDATPVQKQ